jgi:glycosyltransferase involved in cell wall biosynthesis
MQVTAVIPAYNEAATIADITDKLISHSLVDEVVVVDDGSTDNTGVRAQEAGALVVTEKGNFGKGAAMEAGINTSAAQQADIILFLDADLVGLTDKHITKLLQPILDETAEMTLGIFTHGRFRTDFGHKITPFLSGQRAVKREILADMSDLAVTNYGVEMALTRYVKKNKIAVKKVKLEALTHRMKEEKMGFWKGLSERLKMYWEVIKNFPDDKLNQ